MSDDWKPSLREVYLPIEKFRVVLHIKHDRQMHRLMRWSALFLEKRVYRHTQLLEWSKRRFLAMAKRAGGKVVSEPEVRFEPAEFGMDDGLAMTVRCIRNWPPEKPDRDFRVSPDTQGIRVVIPDATTTRARC